jgi:hypothetical protein
MSQYIYKYKLPLTDTLIELEFPMRHSYCDIQLQGDDICIWLIVFDENESLIKKRFKIFGTGQKLDDLIEFFYLKTVQMPNGLVWHVFEVLE